MKCGESLIIPQFRGIGVVEFQKPILKKLEYEIVKILQTKGPRDRRNPLGQSKKSLRPKARGILQEWRHQKCLNVGRLSTTTENIEITTFLQMQCKDRPKEWDQPCRTGKYGIVNFLLQYIRMANTVQQGYSKCKKNFSKVLKGTMRTPLWRALK